MIERLPQFDWNVQSLLQLPFAADNQKYSFLVLNTPIVNPETVLSFWKNATFRMVVDGGGNQLYDLLCKFKLNNDDKFLPHAVSGDFDSIRDDVLSTFRNRNVKIISTPDQNETDFLKGLRVAASFSETKILIVQCENVGRLDHIMANINTLYKAAKLAQTKHFNLFLLASNSLSWLLQPGAHTLKIPAGLWSEKSHCSLLPVGQPCRHVSTTGLKWNLNDDVLQFGGIVSSSNTYDINLANNVVTVKTDDNLIWSMEID